MASIFFEEGLCQGYNFRRNRVCPRIAKAKFHGSFLGGEFRWRFDSGAKWIAQLARMFAVGVVDAPELVARLQSRGRAHGRISSKSEEAMVYQAHKDRAQSV